MEMEPLRVLLLHNYYRQPGGEDTVVARERNLLESHNHVVRLHAVSNAAIRGPFGAIATAWRATYSLSARRRVADDVEGFRPNLVHVHNFFPLLTPSVYDACRAAHVPIVQTLHNYRLLCSNAQLFRDGHVCEECLGKLVPWPGMLHACYRGSRVGSGAVVSMLAVHRLLRTWSEKVDLYIAPTDFARQTFIRGGLPAQKIVVKPHFVDPDPGFDEGGGRYALFVGRLSPEKGLDTLLAAWERLAGRIPLKIVGDGSLAPHVEVVAQRRATVEWLGPQPSSRVFSLMKGARALIFPSGCYESFGMVIAEAFAVGLPVIASDVGTASSLVAHGRTGRLFRHGDAEDLATQVAWWWVHPGAVAEMRREARREFERKYTAAQNYRMLMDAYDRALASPRRAA